MMVTMGDIETVNINLGERAYSVLVGHGAVHQVGTLIPNGVQRIAIVTQEGIPHQFRPNIPGLSTSLHIIGEGESFKNLSTIERLCSEFAHSGLTRKDLVIAVGGGMVTDVAGFAAASYHRGIAVLHVATSLLAMIDAAVGGKTGVNLVEGKNLVGAFWQPCGVVCDLDALETLSSREMDCGFGEMAKYHFIVRENLNDLAFPSRVARCVGIKGEIVATDEREGGIRAFLNYGHTLAHALEIETDFSIAHGEAVALGVLFAAHLGHVLGRIDQARVEEHYLVIRQVYDLKVVLPPGLNIDALIAAMSRDKKALDSLTFVLDTPQGLEVVSDVSVDAIRRAYGEFASRNS
jgi:5-deoxy-5-amino-3-dehydroquinate synthase